MQHTHVLPKPDGDAALSALVKLLEASRTRDWNVYLLVAANLPPSEIPPQGGASPIATASPPGGSPSAATAAPRRRRERELTAVDFAHMEAVFKIREIYRLYKGADSYPAIAKRIFKDYADRLTLNGIVQVSCQTLADHAKKKAWPPSRWRTAYRQKSGAPCDNELTA